MASEDLYNLYARELSSYGYGIALWHPEPDKDWGRVELADVGYVQRGKFWRLFNASLPADHDSHKKCGVPEGFEQIDFERGSCYELDAQPLGKTSSSAVRVGAGITGSALPLGGSVELSNESPRAASLVLNTPLIKDYILHHTGTLIKGYIRKHSESWNVFANRTHGRGIKAEQIMLVTHCYRTTSWSASIQPSSISKDVHFSVSGGVLGAVQAGLGTHSSSTRHLKPIKKSGPPPPDVGASPANTETVFVDGMVLTRFLNKLPLFVRAIRSYDGSVLPLTVYAVDVLDESEDSHADYYAPDYLEHGQPRRPWTIPDYGQGLYTEPTVLDAIHTLNNDHEPNIIQQEGFEIDHDMKAELDRDPLQNACYYRDVATVLSILRSSQSEPLHQYSKKPFGNPLVAAAAGGDEAILLILLDHGADINAYSPDGGCRTALYVAARRGDERMVRILLDAGASIDIDVTANGDTPLRVAITLGHFSIVHLLLGRGASVRAASLGYHPSLIDQVVYGGEDGPLEALLTHGLDEQAARIALICACEMDAPASAELLLDHGTPINFVTDDGSPLEVALAHNAVRVAQRLIDRGADVDAEGGWKGGSPLIAAVAGGHTAMVDILLDKGAKLNVEGLNRGRALHIASASGYTNIVARLLEYGADLDVRHPESDGARSSAIEAAVFRGHIDVVRVMLEHDPHLLKRQDARYGSLHASSSSERTKTEIRQGGTLQAAARTGRTDILEILLDYGANVNLQGPEFGNALQVASIFRHESVINMLLDRGADIEAVGVRNMTALQAATYRRNTEIVDLLLQRGANGQHELPSPSDMPPMNPNSDGQSEPIVVGWVPQLEDDQANGGGTGVRVTGSNQIYIGDDGAILPS